MTLLVEPGVNPLSVDEFLALPDGKGFELIDGVIMEKKPMGALSDGIAVQIAFLLVVFRKLIGGGHVFGSDTMYRCFANPRTGRKPDVSFIRRGRLPGERIPEGSIDIPADLVVEVVSPSDLAYDVEAKAQLYLGNGFGELWVVFPNTRTVHVRRPGEAGIILDADATLIGDKALAGFTCPVREFFPA
jgi:Uma2 family endonuclease